MPGNLKKIVDFVAQKSVLKKTALARLSLLVQEDVTQITEEAPDDPAKEERFLHAAQQIIGMEAWNLNL